MAACHSFKSAVAAVRSSGLSATGQIYATIPPALSYRAISRSYSTTVLVKKTSWTWCWSSGYTAHHRNRLGLVSHRAAASNNVRSGLDIWIAAPA